MNQRKSLVSLVLLLAVSCKTANRAPQMEAGLENYDGLGNDADLPPTQPFWFCPNSRSFNMYNAYWLAEASLMAYSKQANMNALNSKVADLWHSTVTYISSSDPKSMSDPDTQAYWVESDYAVTLAFRGTVNKTLNNIIADFNVWATPFYPGTPEFGQVHRGFKTSLDSIWPQIDAKLQTLKTSKKPLFLTGHSLGGALATMTAARIIMLNANEDVAKNNLVALYTFGAPPIGNATFAKQFEAARLPTKLNVITMRNHDDAVSQAHAKTLIARDPYVHVGSFFYFDELGKLFTNDRNSGLVRYSMSVKLEDELATPMSYRSDQYTDHSILEYIRKLSNEYSVIMGSADQAKADRCEYTDIYKRPRS